MRGTTPQWLYGALDEALVSAGSTASAAQRRAFIDRLVAAWNVEGRSFHNCRYLASVFEKLDELEGATSEPENLKLAAALRGAQEEPGWEEAEEQRGPTTLPVMVSLEDLSDLGLDAEVVSRIGSLVDQLGTHAPKDTDLGARLLVDADLAAFSTSPQKYRDFLTHLRKEASHMPEHQFLALRHRIIEHILGQPRIFSTPLASEWEDSARNNLEAELAIIEAKQAHLGVPPSSGQEFDGEVPPFFPPQHSQSANRPVPEFSADKLMDQFEKARYKHGHPKVLRISRSAKAAKMKDPNEGAQVGSSAAHDSEKHADARSIRAQAVASTSSLMESDVATNEGHRDTSHGSQFDSDTSTLESVADLIENQRTRPPKKRK